MSEPCPTTNENGFQAWKKLTVTLRSPRAIVNCFQALLILPDPDRFSCCPCHHLDIMALRNK